MRGREVVVSVKELFKGFDAGRIQVLKDVTLEIAKGEVVALWGASGSGKTTLLHMMGGLDTPDSGTVWVGGLNAAEERDRLALRRQKVGFVFQLHNLIPDLSVRENCLVTSIATGGDSKQFESRFEELAQELGFDHRQDRRIQDLSGGERQRVALCRALMHRPDVILADEPTGSLDEKSGERVFELLTGLAKKEGTTVVMATHERRFADACDRIFHVRDGRVSEIGEG
ncbi:ABC transporter, ATP-binding protein, putative [Verrucomicrobiia bacterium DG1235]|nr:ABC transporter, ATP-binding protein, putative [Verrucomicrobiae bacterium DG1235]